MIELKITNKDYNSNKHFPQCVVENILPENFAKLCQEEILHIPDNKWDRYENPFERKFTLRDKNNLPENCQKLFDYLSSEQFTKNLSAIVGEKLMSDPTKNWWGIHKYNNGDFLDIHSDAGVHPLTKQKKHVTLGIYLSKNWKEENGGFLEFWDGSSVLEDNAVLYKCVNKTLPRFNKLILFSNTNRAWHGNPTPVKSSKNEKRIFLTLSYLSENHSTDYKNTREKAFFIKRPNDPENPEKDRLRLLRADPIRYKEIYRINK
tara:strand:+ start:296 stop:1081 length:786 start_codon:yes stop_codon:yes gene_type:complete